MTRSVQRGCHAELGEQVRVMAGTTPVRHGDACFAALIEMSYGAGMWVTKLGFNRSSRNRNSWTTI
ncbi:MAG: hypothetical protein KDH20_13930 [Rhodocyclaceae bacterium]|nr:hypothetical protein [Rhodocyclaceae bacterium]